MRSSLKAVWLASAALAACHATTDTAQVLAPALHHPTAAPLTLTSVVCAGYYREGSDNVNKVFHVSNLLRGYCDWYCNTNLITLPYTNHEPVPRIERDVLPNEWRLFNYETNTAALFAQPLATSLKWEIGLGPAEILDEKFSRLTAEDLSQTGFGGLLLVNGDISSAAAYHKYARLKTGRFFVNDSCVALMHFADSPKAQAIRFPNVFPLDTLHLTHLRLDITEVYPGQQDARLAIAELQLDGSGGHSRTWQNCWNDGK